MNKTNILRATILFILLFSIGQITKAQIIISEDMFERSSFSIDLQVRDSVTNQPIGFASVYLQHPKDTIITNFALSDDKGKASIKKVTKGQYLLTIEFMGYLPCHKSFYARGEKDLGILKMAPDIKALEAAKVTAAANPIEVKKDTIIYNAAAFKVGQNSTLLELLKKMPGIEVDDKGNVKVNGQSVSKITIGGKTFFLGDNTVALNNLPAKMVDKVKIIDKDSEAASFSGIADEKKQKVMDVELKDEYKKGTFGNIKIGAGSTAYGNKDKFQDPRGFLYSGSGMLSSFNEKDQLTLIGSSRNAQMLGEGVLYGGISEDDGFLGMGLPKTVQAAANYNTSRWKGMESNISANFKSNQLYNLEESDKTTFQEKSDDILSTRIEKSNDKRNSIKISGYLNNEDKKKYTFEFKPTFYFSDTDKNAENNSSSSYASTLKNRANTLTGSSLKYFNTDGNVTFGIKNLGKKRRSLTFTGQYLFGGSNGNSSEYSSTYYAALDSTVERNLFYDRTSSNYTIGGSVQYVEPIGKLWAVQTFFSSYYKVNKNENTATNADGSHNDYYSSNSDNYYSTNYGRLLLQYRKDDTNLQFGGLVRAISNENYARSYSIDTRTGVGDWIWSWSPFIRFNATYKDINFNIRYNGNAERPSQSSIVPTMNIINPTIISIGNIYLNPSFSHEIYFDMEGSDNESHISYNISPYFSVGMNESVTASWFDSNSVQYSIPVNSKKDSYKFSMYGNFSSALNKKKNLRFFMTGSLSINRQISYQSSGLLDGLNTENFDYSSFMSKFWGESNGNRFYSGASGFKESNTIMYNISLYPSLSYKGDYFSISGAPYANMNSATYSLDSKADVKTWQIGYDIFTSYNTAKDLELSSQLRYVKFIGYPEGYNEPKYIWGAEISKSIRGITLSLMIDDILNQNKDRSAYAGENYKIYTRTLTLGRQIMASITFNFGKANAARSQSAQDSMWNLLF
jgi:hypothetical protein